MSKFTAGIEIKAFDQFSRTMDKFVSEMNAVSKSTKKAQQRLNDFSNATAGVSTALKRMGMAAGIAFAAITALAIKSGSEFETALANLSAMTNQTEGNLTILGDSSLVMAKKFGNSASSILEGMTRIASAKSELMTDPAGLKEFTNAAGILAKIANTSFEQAGESVVAMTNIFKDQGLTAAQAIDQLSASTVKGILKITQLQQALSISGGVAALAGLDFAETQAAIQAVGRTGLKTSTIARQMKNIFLRLSIAVPGLKDGTQDFFEVLQKLNKEDLSPKFLKKWLGAENIPAWQGLMENLDFAKDMRDVVRDQSAGKAMEMFAKVMDTVNEASKRLWQTINNKLIMVFNDLLGPILKKTIGWLTDFTEWMFSGSKGAKVFALAIGAMAFVLTTAFVALSALVGIPAIVMWAAAAKAAIISLAVTFHAATGGIFLIIGAVLALVPALWALSAWMRSDNETSFFKTILNDLKDFWSIVKTIFGAIWGVVRPIFEFLIPEGGDGLKLIGTILKWVLGIFVAISTVIAVLIIAPLMIVVGIIMGIWKLWLKISDVVSKVFEDVTGFKPIEIFDTENIEAAWQKVKDIFNVLKGGVSIQEAADLSVGGFSQAAERNRTEGDNGIGLMDFTPIGLALRAAEFGGGLFGNNQQNNINIAIANEDGKARVTKVDGSNTNVTTEESITGPGQINEPALGF